MKKIRKNISIDEDVLNKAIERAKKLGLSLSAYLTTLINKEGKNNG